jgi:hypothetical protein
MYQESIEKLTNNINVRLQSTNLIDSKDIDNSDCKIICTGVIKGKSHQVFQDAFKGIPWLEFKYEDGILSFSFTEENYNKVLRYCFRNGETELKKYDLIFKKSS